MFMSKGYWSITSKTSNTDISLSNRGTKNNDLQKVDDKKLWLLANSESMTQIKGYSVSFNTNSRSVQQEVSRFFSIYAMITLFLY